MVLLYTANQARQARDELHLVAADLKVVQARLSAGDIAGAQRSLAQAQQQARQAHQHTDGPVWATLGHLPGIGDDVTAVRTVARVSDGLTTSVLPDVMLAGQRLNPSDFRPVKGKVDLRPIVRAQPLVSRIDLGMRQQQQEVAGIATGGLIGPVAGPVEDLQDKLQKAADATHTVALATRLLPPMLGAEQPRRYLLMFQNNAEMRSGGGVPGSFAVVKAQDGRISLGKRVSDQTLGDFSKQPVAMTTAEKRMFGVNLGRFVQDITMTPDFPRSAQLLSEMWRRHHDVPLDGVMSADPVALSQLLKGTGPVAVPGGRLTSANAVSTLLSRTYARLPDPAAQDAFFAVVTRSVFDAVASGQGQPRQVVSGLATAAGQRRLLLWSSRTNEERLLAPTTVGGKLTTAESDRPQVGVYLNDSGASKLDYYLHHRVDVQPRNCTDGRQRMVVTLHVRSSVPRDTATLPTYVANNAAGQPRGRMVLTVLTYAPPGGSIAGERVDGRPVDAIVKNHDGRQVAQREVFVDPGGSHVIRWYVVGGRGQTRAPLLQVTPGANSDGVGSVGRSVC